MNRPASTACIAGTCEVNGIEVHYLRTGGDKPPLVALHGLIGNGSCLLPLSRSLNDQFDLILPDARGHGRSSAPTGRYSYDDHVSDVIGVIAALNLVRPVLLGHSMGGMTAALVASQLGSGVDALVLIEPTFLEPERQRQVYESNIGEDTV